MKNQIKNDLNNIKNSGQIVINTSISNNSESSEWQTEDLIEKTETSDVLIKETIASIFSFLASAATVFDFCFNRLDGNVIHGIIKATTDIATGKSILFAVLCIECAVTFFFTLIGVQKIKDVVTLKHTFCFGTYVYNAKSHKTYKVTSKPCPKCKKVCSKPLKIRVSDTSKMRFFCPHCSSSFDISAIDILESIGLDNQKPKK